MQGVGTGIALCANCFMSRLIHGWTVAAAASLVLGLLTVSSVSAQAQEALSNDRGTDLLLSGHEHNYERFAPLSAAGSSNPDGIRQFVVGTGGTTLRGFYGTATGSKTRISNSHGVLRLQLSVAGYDWDFLSTKNSGRSDAGSTACS